MATNGLLDLGNAFIRFSENLQWRVVETQAKIVLHTGDCNKYSYFFDDEPSKPIKHPCMLGYKYWTDLMATDYLSEKAHNCEFYMPTIDYDVEYVWEHGPEEQAYRLTRVEEEEDIQMPERYQMIKHNIELHWNFLRHIAKTVVNHNKECKDFKLQNGKFGCLENFTRWDERITMEYYEPKTECDYLKKTFM
jgi:hypothetical protein